MKGVAEASAITVKAIVRPYVGPVGKAATGSGGQVTLGTYTWRALLPATYAERDADGRALRYTLTAAQSDETAVIEDMLFGEVWVCSGQVGAFSTYAFW